MDNAREVTVQKVVRRLTDRFPRSTPSEVNAIVTEEYDLLADAPIRTFVSNLVEHEAKERLQRAR